MPTPTSKPHWKDLFAEVVDTGTCSGCAACVVACPRKVLGYTADRPFQMDEPSGHDGCRFGDAGCDVCTRACHRFHLDMPAIETAVVGRERRADEVWGVVRNELALRAVDGGVHRAGQDGGLVSALLVWALETGRIDGAVVSALDPERPLATVPVVVDTPAAVLAAAGSRYTYSTNMLALADAAPSRRLAFVSTPCQISSVRKSQHVGLKRFRSIIFTVGLMCSETFEPGLFVDELIAGRLGLDLRQVWKVNVKGRVLVYTSEDETERLATRDIGDSAARAVEPGVVEIPLKECRPTARDACHWCPDFAGEWADISTGGLGLEGWTITLMRTEAGEEWVRALLAEGRVEARPTSDFPSALTVMDRLARKQRRRPATRLARMEVPRPTGYDGTAVLMPVPPAPAAVPVPEA